ncbi:DUF6114 domain-containing protein [Actinoplanes sp. NPDC049802]|uniref:DUF6114 domain-containing protein n=1 Tax=Actinoplanes sp. NPDC049802 TaxID=3154742 RepID=UPI0033D3D468
MATESFWDRFRRWRRARPFWGGLVMLLSGLEMFVSANLELDNIKIHIGPQGYYSYLLPVIMLACGALAWFTPAQRLFYGVVGIITALYSFIGLNLGGWVLGMMLGIVGGALVVAWGAPRNQPSPRDQASPREPSSAGEPDERATAEIPPVTVDPTIVPGIDPEPGPPRRRPVHRKALIIMAPLLVASTVAVAGNRPAEAAECPEGLPSRKPGASASPSASPSRTSRKPAPTTPASPSAGTTPTPTPTPPKTGDHPILDGINDFWEGVGDLIGIGGESPDPAPSPTVSATPSPSSAAPSSAAPSKTPTVEPSPSKPAGAEVEEIPCLGARQVGLLAEDGGIPLAGAKPGVVRAASVTMYNSSYDGVAEVPTGDGPVRSLKFTMDKVVNKPFSLTIDEPGNATTIIESGELILDGDVEFYSPEFKGKLFGLIPVTFTPEQPPPLTLPVLWFTDVTLHLAYVKSNVLTAEPIDINERIG